LFEEFFYFIFREHRLLEHYGSVDL